MTTSMSALIVAMSFSLLPVGLQTAEEVGAAQPAPVASPETPAGLDIIEGEAREVLLDEIATALSNVETAKGRFRQYNGDFTEAAGDFYIRRPGRVRFEYDEPNPLLIIADGTTVAIEDKDLATQDRLPLGATPLSIIIDDDIDLTEKVTILGVERTSDYIAVTMEDKTGEMDGQLAMVFDVEDYALLQWQTVDPNGALTIVELSAVETGTRINPRLFRIEELGEEDERD